MSDDLVKRLRSGLSDFDDWGAAADRIEELEAKLAKAACFITDIEAGPSWGESLPSWVNNRMLKARTTLAELKG